MTHPRGLSAEEAALWEKLASTVRPINPPKPVPAKGEKAGNHAKHGDKIGPNLRSASSPPASGVPGKGPGPGKGLGVGAPRQKLPPSTSTQPPSQGGGGTLDSHWDRRLARRTTEPDFSLDLHGHTLDQAYMRLNDGLIQAKAMNARLVLVVTGKSRPVDAADRATKRGAIRAKILDWLAAGQHASDIAAIRKAHRRHGGEGALYIVLKRGR